MTRLVVCCDGTWNTPDQEKGGVPTPTNVVRLYNTLVEDADQRRYYHPGVGTDGGFVDHLMGGGMGAGLAANIKSAYAWLARYHTDGDSIHLFGFSRGAYTVRSLAGMLRACGLPRISNPPTGEEWRAIDDLYDEVYRPDHPGRDEDARPPHPRVDVAFLGVWDTVGALGIPATLGILNLFDVDERHKFDDTCLGPHIRHARHAVALDEARGPFTPTLWANVAEVDRADGRTARQMWFTGDHSGVGGGYAEVGLSDLALRWMISETQAVRSGLAFHKGMVDQIRENGHDDVLHDSCTTAYKLMGALPRAVPLLDPDATPAPGSEVHPAALKRQSCAPITQSPYRGSQVLAVGATAGRAVFAREPWNATGLWLEPGEYEFTAAGEWLDGSMAVGPGGTKDGKFHRGEVKELVGACIGWLQERFRDFTGNHAATFFGAPRCVENSWMELIGVVAAENLGENGVQEPYEFFPIGSGCELRVDRPGYLYAFANDAWAFYDDNRGSVELTVRRVS